MHWKASLSLELIIRRWYESYRGFRGGSDLVRTFLGAVSVDPDPADLLEVLEAWSADQMQQVA
jgi:hypothetical protein